MKKLFRNLLLSAMTIAALSGCKNGDLSGYAGMKTEKIDVDVAVVEDVDAQEPSEVSIIVDCANAWVAQVSEKWVTVEPDFGGGGKTVVTLTFAPNFKNDETDMPARSANLTIASHGTVVTIPVRQNGFVGEKKEVTNLGGIPDVVEFKAFAAAATAGLTVARWTNEESGAVELMADIDLSGEEWTPIGMAEASNAGAVDGTPFEGVFDGKGHKVKGVKLAVNNPVGKNGYGFFGVLNGATIRNLNVELVSLTVDNPDISANATVHIGGLAGAAVKSVIENCSVSGGDISLKFSQTSGATGLHMIGGLLGSAYASTVSESSNSAKVLCYNEINTNNGGSGVQMGGVIGYCNGECTVTKCTNNGQIGDMVGSEKWGSACRLGGIIGTTQGMAHVIECVNNGKLVGTCTCTSDKTSRTAGVVAYVNTAGTELTKCVNNGDVCFAPTGTFGGYLGGFVGQQANAIVIDGCETHGAILGDLFINGHFNSETNLVGGFFSDNLETDDFPEMGLVVGRPNTKASTLKNCKFSGKIGAYSDASTIVTITAENFHKYLYGCTHARRLPMQNNAANENNTYSE